MKQKQWNEKDGGISKPIKEDLDKGSFLKQDFCHVAFFVSSLYFCPSPSLPSGPQQPDRQPLPLANHRLQPPYIGGKVTVPSDNSAATNVQMYPHMTHLV